MTEDILDKMNDDFNDESMKDILDDSSGEIEDIKKESLFKKLVKKVFRSKKAVIIIAISCFLLISLVTGAWFFFFKPGPRKGEEVKNKITANKDIKKKLPGKEEIIFKDIVELEPFERIKLKTSSTMGLISMDLSLELTDHRYRKQVYTMEDRIRKIITGQLGEMTWLVLRNPEGKILLKYNLLKRINSIFPKPTVRNIYFTNFIMQ
ncbi:MAG: flagellar basal body-associated FliL family protein [Deltaproteobacteria bacterium]|nr:flagellar basal body-associated FliL family protein [Deltaproteobacteria bacterium]